MAIALADEEGLAAVSMPRLARRLGMTQNALYRYFPSKDDLLVLMGDAASPAVPLMDPGAGWRSNVRAWTMANLGRYVAHPWLLDLRVRPPLTPNALIWLDAFLDGMSATGLGSDHSVQCALLLDGYARSTAALVRDLRTPHAAYSPAAVEELTPLLEGRGAHRVAEFLRAAALGGQSQADGAGEEVDFGLERILDGMERLIDQS